MESDLAKDADILAQANSASHKFSLPQLLHQAHNVDADLATTQASVNQQLQESNRLMARMNQAFGGISRIVWGGSDSDSGVFHNSDDTEDQEDDEILAQVDSLIREEEEASQSPPSD